MKLQTGMLWPFSRAFRIFAAPEPDMISRKKWSPIGEMLRRQLFDSWSVQCVVYFPHDDALTLAWASRECRLYGTDQHEPFREKHDGQQQGAYNADAALFSGLCRPGAWRNAQRRQ